MKQASPDRKETIQFLKNKEQRLKIKWPQILTILTPKNVLVYISLTLHLPLLAGVFEYKTRVVHSLIIEVETCWALTIRSLPKLVEVKIVIIWLKSRKVRIRPLTHSGTSALYFKVMRRHQVNRRARYRFLLNWRSQNFVLHRRDKRMCYLKRILPQKLRRSIENIVLHVRSSLSLLLLRHVLLLLQLLLLLDLVLIR